MGGLYSYFGIPAVSRSNLLRVQCVIDEILKLREGEAQVEPRFGALAPCCLEKFYTLRLLTASLESLLHNMILTSLVGALRDVGQ
jgi:hypothetical protein